jgi:hypothetical protein
VIASVPVLHVRADSIVLFKKVQLHLVLVNLVRHSHMADDENTPPPTTGRRLREDGLQLGPRKKAYIL